MANTLTTQKPKFSVALQTDAYQKLINNTLGDKAKAQRFIASISSAVAVNPALQECTPSSIISSALLGEALNLSPSPQLGFYYLVPYKNKNGETQAQFQLGYKSYIQLAIRSGQYKDIDVIEIKEGEYLGRDKETGKFLFEFISDESERLKKETIGYLGYFELINGFTKKLYISKEAMEKHADTYSKAFNLADYKRLKEGKIPEKDLWKYSSFWYKNFDSMASKTVIRQLLSKFGIMSIEMQDAYVKDMSVMETDGTYNYVDSTNPRDLFPEATIIEKEPTKVENIDEL